MLGDMVPIVAITFSFAAAIAIVALVLRYRARKLEHEEIIKSLEHGQDLPVIELRRKYSYLNDLRIGVIMIAAGMGAYIFLRETRFGSEWAAVGLIPLLIGIGYVIMSFVLKNISENNGEEGK